MRRVPYGEVGHGGALRDTPVQHGVHEFDFEHPYVEPRHRGGPAVQ